MIFKGIVTDSLQIFIILIEILSHPCDFLESSDFIIDSISLFVKRKEFILVLVLHKRGGNTLLFFISVHIETKKLFTKFAFLQYSEIKLPSTNKGGIAGIFLLQRRRFNISQ